MMLLLLRACDSFNGTDVRVQGEDASTPDTLLDGGATDAGACRAELPYAPPVPLYAEESVLPRLPTAPRLTRDELTLYFHAYPPEGGAQLDVYTATRASRLDPWPRPTPVAGVSTPTTESFPSVDEHGDLMVFESGRSGVEAVWLATRGDNAAPFLVEGAPLATTTGHNEGQPYFEPLTKSVYFISDARGSKGAYDIFAGTLVGGLLANVSPVSGVNSTATEGMPTLTQDALQLYFVSDRADAGSHVYVSARAGLDAGFDSAALASDVDGRLYPSWFSPDGCRVYGYRASEGGLELVMATRPQ